MIILKYLYRKHFLLLCLFLWGFICWSLKALGTIWAQSGVYVSSLSWSSFCPSEERKRNPLVRVIIELYDSGWRIRHLRDDSRQFPLSHPVNCFIWSCAPLQCGHSRDCRGAPLRQQPSLPDRPGMPRWAKWCQASGLSLALSEGHSP